jgi:hypothetical protein
MTGTTYLPSGPLERVIVFIPPYRTNDREEIYMTETCCLHATAGSDVCELPAPTLQRTLGPVGDCPVCHRKGKPVQGQTVKALLSVTLRQVQNSQYLFCRTPTCPIVYFTPSGDQTFTVDQVRERVYQKESSAEDVFVCYCFRHTIGEIRRGSQETRDSILNDINSGIQVDQCACDLRNPQGSCCLGNVQELMNRPR